MAGSIATRSPSRSPEVITPAEFMPEDEWLFQIGIANAAFANPMQVRTANAN